MLYYYLLKKHLRVSDHFLKTSKAKYNYWSQQPPMDVLIGSSSPPPNASNESAKALSPLNASPRAALLKTKKQNKKSATSQCPVVNLNF
jgi:hypothetical protein